MPGFTGFRPETFAFLRDLAAENSKAWFDANRDSYETHVLAPSLDFIAALAPRIAPLGYHAEPRLNASFRRLNRDVRFSKDKSPYSPRIHMIFWTGDHPLRSPAAHLVLHADGLGFGVGEWGWPPARITAFRARLEDAQARASLESACASAAAVGAQLTPPELKRLPKGVAEDHPAADYLRRKSLVARTPAPMPLPAQTGGDSFLDHAGGLLEALDPINKWLIDELK